ncbi:MULTISPECIES: hypothetical protein [unclassified Wolbachia]|nr:hypothetical protein [Wolbachia endosymbiont (group A) of Apoderus coryli]
MLPFLSSQCLTLGSRLGTKLVNMKAFTTFLMELREKTGCQCHALA